MTRPTRKDCRYAPFYCEENVWWLAQRDDLRPGLRFVVFISNPGLSCALWSQRAAQPDNAVIWDYHVVLLVQDDMRSWIYDLDSRTPFPAPARAYLKATFHELLDLRPEFLPMFRVVPAAEFVAAFASDRSHMTEGGAFRSEPPPWPAIGGQGGAPNNLPRFIDVQAPFLGEIFDRDGLEQNFT